MSVGTLVTSGGIVLDWRVTDLGKILVPSYRHRLLHRLLSQLEVEDGEVEVSLEGEARPDAIPFLPIPRLLPPILSSQVLY